MRTVTSSVLKLMQSLHLLIHTHLHALLRPLVCVQAAAERHAGGRIVSVHEGGYSELYVPFCGLAVIEQLARTRSKVCGGDGRGT